MTKTKILLDADVIIHFAKGGLLSQLPSILNNYEHVVLDKVYNEIKGQLKSQLDNQIRHLKNIQIIPYDPKGEELKEYAQLLQTLGSGESACLAYCRYNHEVIGSSNLKDIKDYCQIHRIVYLTTLDFLYFAIQKKLMTTEEANLFIKEVCAKGSKLPDIDMSSYRSFYTVPK